MGKSNEGPSELSGPQSYKVHWDIVLLAREITKTFEFIFSEFDLNLTDVALISLIDQSDAFTQSQLAKSLGIGKARLGIVINGLETKDILEFYNKLNSIIELELVDGVANKTIN